MKFILVLYAILGMGIQVAIGQLTGYGQGSIGLLAFLFMIELDPRFKFSYILPNIRSRKQETEDAE